MGRRSAGSMPTDRFPRDDLEALASLSSGGDRACRADPFERDAGEALVNAERRGYRRSRLPGCLFSPLRDICGDILGHVHAPIEEEGVHDDFLRPFGSQASMAAPMSGSTNWR